MPYLRLIRFENAEGKEQFGEPQIEDADELPELLQSGKLFAKILEGTSPFKLSAQSGSPQQVKRILPVLLPADVPIIKCVGLNYIRHSELK